MLWKAQLLEHTKTLASTFGPNFDDFDWPLDSCDSQLTDLYLVDQKISLHFKGKHRLVEMVLNFYLLLAFL